MKLLSRLVIALIICLIAVPVLAVPAQAQEDEPYIMLSSSLGHPGEEITVRGYTFIYHEDVDIWYYRDTSTSSRNEMETVRADSDGSFPVSFIIPESCTGEHRILADGDEGSYVYGYFTVEPGIEVTPAEGSVGTTVRVKGTGFDSEERYIEVRYYLEGSNSEIVKSGITAGEYGSWETTFLVPASSKGTHKIDAKGEDSSLGEVEGASFEVKPGISLSKSSGYVGDTITVNGSGFRSRESDVTVTYDGEQIGLSTTADRYGAWTISLEVPPSTQGTHKIDAYGSSTSASVISDKNFTVISRIMLVPTEGHVGTNLSVSGTGFAAVTSVSITYDGVQQAAPTTDNKGSFSNVSFGATHTQSVHTVNHPVAATGAEPVNFIMESTPPAVPALTSPANGSRVGLVGKICPTFEWSAVTDPSGVSYRLQVASDENFSSLAATEVSGLTEASYTLPEEQALPYGVYYWRVKAIDGAQNDSGWAALYSFKAGLLPLWAFIAIVALIVVVIGALVYFFGIRRRGRYYS